MVGRHRPCTGVMDHIADHFQVTKVKTVLSLNGVPTLSQGMADGNRQSDWLFLF